MSADEQYWPMASGYWTVVSSRAVSEQEAAAPAPVGGVSGTTSQQWDESEDGDLVAAVQAGHRDAFDVLVVRHQRAVYRICFRFAGRHEDASDLTQEVFLRAYRAMATFRQDASFKTWLYRIAVNVGLSRVSVKSPAFEELEPDHPSHETADGLDEQLDQARRSARLRAAVDRLPPKQKAAVILRVYQDLSHEETARVLGCTVGTVKANVFHALRKLRALLGER